MSTLLDPLKPALSRMQAFLVQRENKLLDTISCAFTLALFCGIASAQTATITAPTSGAVLSGTSTLLTSTCSACTNIGSAEYDVNGELVGIVRTPPYSVSYDTFYPANNPSQHSVTVTYRDSGNNVIATSPAVTFGVENNLPQNTCPPNGSVCTDLTVTSGVVSQMALNTTSASTSAVVSFFGSGAVTVVGGNTNVFQATCGGCGTLSLPSHTYTAGNAIVMFARWQGVTNALTCSDANSDTPSYGTFQPHGSNHSVQWCYMKVGTTFTGTATAAESGGLLNILGAQITGQDPTSPLDVNVGGGIAATQPTSPIITLTHPAANEIIFGGATFEGTFTAASVGPWTLTETSDQFSAIQIINPPTNGTWYGGVQVTLTAGGDNATADKYYVIYVDGQSALSTSSPGVTTNPITTYFNSSLYTNQSHAVVVDEFSGNCPSCANGVWNYVGQWESQVTFYNAASQTQMVASWRDIVLCVTPSTNCPSSASLTESYLNADGTTTAVSSPTFAVSTSAQLGNETVGCSVTSSGATATVTAISSNNGCYIVATDPVTGFTRQSWVYVPPSTNIYPHFRSDGSVGTTYTSGSPSSVWHASLFGGSALFNPLPGYQTSATNYPAVYGPIYKQAFNTLEFEIFAWGSSGDGSFTCTSPTTTQANYQGCAANSLAKYVSYMNNNGLYGHCIAAGIVDSTSSLMNTVYGVPSAFSTPALQYYFAQLASAVGSGTGIIGCSLADEVSDKWSFTPLLGTDTSGIFLNTPGGPTQIACIASGLCTVSWNNWSLIGSNRFIITGSGTLLDYNTTSGAPSSYATTSPPGNSFTFPTPGGLSTTTFTFGSSPSLLMEPLVNNAYDSSVLTNAASSTNACPPGGSSSGPCPEYLHYNALMLAMQQVYTGIGSAHIPVTWPPKASNYGQTLSWWNGKFMNMAGFAMGTYQEGYFSPNSPGYLGDKTNLGDVESSFMQFARLDLASMNLASSMILESEATIIDYVFQGNSFNVTSCSGNTITTSAPHGIYNITPDSTRATVTGSSSGACDGSYYIIAAPTSTTLTVALANATYTGTPSGTITFSNGNTAWTVGSWSNNTQAYTTATQGTIGSTTITVASTTGLSSCIGVSSHTCYVVGGGIPDRTVASGLAGSVVTINQATTAALASTPVTFLLDNYNQENSFEGTGDGTGCPGNGWKNNRGQTFTVASGASGSTFWFTSDTLNVCPAGGQGGASGWRQIPNLSSTGGTIQIIPNNSYIRGNAWPINSETGPRYMFATIMGGLIVGDAGHRAYGYGEPPDTQDLTITGVNNSYGSSNSRYDFQSTNFNLGGFVQGQINPTVDYVRSQIGWIAHQTANLMAERIIKFAYGQKLPSQDLGNFYEDAARVNTNGTVYMPMTLADNTLNCTYSWPSSYLTSGQSIIRLSATWSGIDPIAILAPGTTSDSTKTCAPGEFRAYMFTVTYATELNQPAIAPRLADITGATGFYVQWTYGSALAFTSPSVASQTLYATFNCTSSPCTTVPWDRNIGTIYYKMIFYNSSGKTLATSDVQFQ